jgi:hypothetical protein
LGRAVRDHEHPARFSLLTPKAHLKAWLKFADNKRLREQALAGARKLDHRTPDAVEMLGEDEYSPFGRRRRAAPSPRGRGLADISIALARCYRAREDDPRPYQELLLRLGDGVQFPALKWLPEHGCDAEAELGEADTLVRAYQDLSNRAAMLATLAQLRIVGKIAGRELKPRPWTACQSRLRVNGGGAVFSVNASASPSKPTNPPSQAIVLFGVKTLAMPRTSEPWSLTSLRLLSLGVRSRSLFQHGPDHVLGVAFANWPKASSAWLAYITEGPAPM